MRILHVTPFYEPYWAAGGMARASAALCRGLVRRGHEVMVATALLAPGPPQDETRDGVRVRRFPGPRLLARFLVPWAPGLARFLREVLPTTDAVHVHGHRSGLALTTARVLRDAGRRWVLQPAGTYPTHGQHVVAKASVDRLGGDAVVSGAAAVIAVSDAEARDLPRPARVVPNGVEPCGTPAATSPRSRPRLLFVGSDRTQKRGQRLPELLAALPDVELRLVGAMGSAFTARFARFGARVTVAGVLAGDALATAYADADLLLHPAVGEAFGLVPFEAALAGTAAVVAGGHGCGEWYAKAGGCVVPPDDADALRSAVRARLADPALARGEVAAVAAFARARLGWDAAAAAVEAVYRDVER